MPPVPAMRVPSSPSRLGVHLPDDRYVPLRADDLIAALVDDAERFGLEAAQVHAVAEALDRVVAQETEELRRGLERAYHPFNPARDALLLGDDEAGVERVDRVRRLVAHVLDKANYELLDAAQVQAAVGAANSYGIRIRVNPERVQWIELWVRGRTLGTRKVRTLRRPIKGEEHEDELYRRLAVVFQSKDDDALNLKLFREIPVADVEALLPHAEVAMSGLDRLKVLGGSLGALGGVVTRVLESTILTSQLLWLFVLGLGGLSVRSFFGYRRAKRTRLSHMTHHLYYRNVANNAGVLDQLVGSLGHEDLKEAMLAWVVVHGGGARDDAALHDEVASWLLERFAVEVDFDGPDAVATLERLGLWEDRDGWRVRGPAAAVTELERTWQERRTAGHHLQAAMQRHAPSLPSAR
jgi:hypothetical protein